MAVTFKIKCLYSIQLFQVRVTFPTLLFRFVLILITFFLLFFSLILFYRLFLFFLCRFCIEWSWLCLLKKLSPLFDCFIVGFRQSTVFIPWNEWLLFIGRIFLDFLKPILLFLLFGQLNQAFLFKVYLLKFWWFIFVSLVILWVFGWSNFFIFLSSFLLSFRRRFNRFFRLWKCQLVLRFFGFLSFIS